LEKGWGGQRFVILTMSTVGDDKRLKKKSVADPDIGGVKEESLKYLFTGLLAEGTLRWGPKKVRKRSSGGDFRHGPKRETEKWRKRKKRKRKHETMGAKSDSKIFCNLLSPGNRVVRRKELNWSALAIQQEERKKNARRGRKAKSRLKK